MYKFDEINPPKDFYETTLEWITVSKSSVEDYYKEIFPGTPNYRNIWSSKIFVVVVPDGRTWGVDGIVITPDNKLLWDVSREWVHDPKESSIFKIKTLPPVSTTFDTVGVLAHKGGHNYYHWMFDILPRLDLLQRSGIKVDKYVVNECSYSFQNETLAALGIQKDQLIQSHKDLHLKAKKLVVPSPPGCATRWACNFLRSQFLYKRKPSSLQRRERIYVSREKAWFRKIRNEGELLNVLSKFGFKAVNLELLSVTQQVELFSSAEIVVAPHGAGLTNLVFCSPGTKVIEFFSPTYLEPCYQEISHFVGIDYYALIGKEHIPPYANSDAYWPGMDDISIDPIQLLSKLTETGIKQSG